MAARRLAGRVKWHQESPSPEPETLTPSELDALEAIPPDSPKPLLRAQPETMEEGGIFGRPWAVASRHAKNTSEDASLGDADEGEGQRMREGEKQA